MKCPVCSSVNLVMAERQGVEIDYCPECRGVWLDRGELDKIIERAAPTPAEQPECRKESHYRNTEPSTFQSSHNHPYHQGYQEHKGHGYGNGHHYKKKKSMLSEIFDFD